VAGLHGKRIPQGQHRNQDRPLDPLLACGLRRGMRGQKFKIVEMVGEVQYRKEYSKGWIYFDFSMNSRGLHCRSERIFQKISEDR
ncbi:MAG: hypothetical protein ACYDAM_12210, partial [Leptospirales bacterium]